MCLSTVRGRLLCGLPYFPLNYLLNRVICIHPSILNFALLASNLQPPVPPPTSSTTSSTASTTQAASSTPTTGTTQSAPAGGQATTGMSNEIFTQLVGGISSYVSQAALGQQPADTVGDFLDRLGEQYGMSQGERKYKNFV